MNILRFFRQTYLELLRIIFKLKKTLAITDPTIQYIQKMYNNSTVF
jgi:hypothetical protein